MEFLYDLPLLGFIFQIVGYLINAILNTNLAPQTLALATPIALGALCGIKIVLRPGKIGTAVLTVLIEKQVVEVGRKDVVVGDVSPRPLASRYLPSFTNWRTSGHASFAWGLTGSYGPPAQSVPSLSCSRSSPTPPKTIALIRPLPTGRASTHLAAGSSYQREVALTAVV
jgi:hypothetical protein